MPNLRPLLVVLALVIGSGGAAAQPAQSTPPAAPAEPYHSPMREQCGQELRKDFDWQANITDVYEVVAHEKAAAKIQRNERHVFIAYGVIWVLVALFVGMMWLRQGKLNAEIKRLEAELRRIEDEDRKRQDQAKPGKGAGDHE